MKTILLFSLFALSFLTTSPLQGQYTDVKAAIASLNTIMATSPNPCTFEIAPNGVITKRSTEYDVTYTFNMIEVNHIEYQEEGGMHRLAMYCTVGKQCFFSDQNEGGGLKHFLIVNSKAEADQVVAALEYIKEQVSF